MSLHAKLRKAVGTRLRGHPRLRRLAVGVNSQIELRRHSAAGWFPGLIRPDPHHLYVALTADCNLRCTGCRYGREFQAGHELPWPDVKDLLDDAKASGFTSVRLYGGEPLLRRDLPTIVAYSIGLGLNTWVTTNGIALRHTIDDLYDAGLRSINVGLYGIGDRYNAYTGRGFRSFARMEAGLAYTRERYGSEVNLSLGWVLMRPTCTTEVTADLFRFADRYAAPFYVNLINYTTPYFTLGPAEELQFRAEDELRIDEVVAELIRLKRIRPDLVLNSLVSLRSIPDWLLKKADMRVPCDRRELIWVGADGTVQMCQQTFELGNLHQKRLRDILFSAAHGSAARDAFALNCPNCPCSYETRTERHAPSRHLYSRPGALG